MEGVQIFNRDVHWFLNRFIDSKDVLMYLDPPYPEANQGPYSGFTMLNFNLILEKLYNAEFKFLISFYKKNKMNLTNFQKNKRFNFYTKKSKCRTLKKVEDREEVLMTNF